MLSAAVVAAEEHTLIPPVADKVVQVVDHAERNTILQLLLVLQI